MINTFNRELLKQAKRIVVKVGSSTITYANGKRNFSQIDRIARELSDLQNQGKEMILVTSGAVAVGVDRLGLPKKPDTIPGKQAAAAVGQGVLMHTYEKIFADYGQIVAQVLLTKTESLDRHRYTNSRNTFMELIKQRVIPIVNENDVVALDELKIGDNDNMSALVAGIIDADLGLMGTDLRASEQTYQLLSQVSGRAGRGDKKGIVYLQTLYPENAVLRALINNNREDFLNLEKKSRKILSFPPFGKLAAIIVSSTNVEKAEKVASELIKYAPRMEGVNILGPAPAPIYMLRGKYRYRLLLKTLKIINIQEILKKWLGLINVPSNVRVEVDIDPYSFM